MLLSAMSVLVVAQSSSEIPEGLMNNSVLVFREVCAQRLAKLSTALEATMCQFHSQFEH